MEKIFRVVVLLTIQNVFPVILYILQVVLGAHNTSRILICDIINIKKEYNFKNIF